MGSRHRGQPGLGFHPGRGPYVTDVTLFDIKLQSERDDLLVPKLMEGTRHGYRLHADPSAKNSAEESS
jgi:hypothetical protein